MAADALATALALLKTPASVREVRRFPLPAGVPFLLEVANADTAAIEQARRRTGYDDHFLEEAAAFFIEQILLDRRADSYRILGGTQAATHAELRRNMALLMRWLHPDRKSQRSTVAIDRDVFAGRVSRAWEDLKSDERRAAYDAKYAAAVRSPRSAGRPSRTRPAAGAKKGSGMRTAPGRFLTPEARAAGWQRARSLRPVSLWRRILGFLRGKP